jgi:hypothetical protein
MPFTSKAQQRFMFAKHPKIAKKWAEKTPDIKSLPQHVKKEEGVEEIITKEPKPIFDSTVEFWVVEKPKSPTENPQMLVHKADPFMFARQVMGGFRPEEVHGFYTDEDEATNAAHDLVQAVFESAKALEEKKEEVTTKLEKHISRLQKEINQHMKAAGDNPMEADNHHSMAERKMAMIKELRSKCKMVEAAKKQLTKKEEK